MAWTIRTNQSLRRSPARSNLPAGWRPRMRVNDHRHRSPDGNDVFTGPGYVLGIGSNIDPERNAARILECLVQRFGMVRISRIYYTAPVAMESRRRFVNFCAYVPSNLRPLAFKEECNRIEAVLGRDRSNPRRSVLDRPADLDPLTRLLNADIPIAGVEDSVADYLLKPARELLASLTQASIRASLRQDAGELARCRVKLRGWVLGETPATIYRDDRTGQIVVT